MEVGIVSNPEPSESSRSRYEWNARLACWSRYDRVEREKCDSAGAATYNASREWASAGTGRDAWSIVDEHCADEEWRESQRFGGPGGFGGHIGCLHWAPMNG